MVKRPEIPVGQFAVELPVEFVRVEGLAPRLMKLFEIAAFVFRHERRQGEVVQDLDVGAVWVVAADILDQLDLFQHVATLILLAQASVDDRERQCTVMPHEKHGGHIEKEVDLTGDVGKLGACVMVLLQVEGEEEIGLEVPGGVPGAEIERGL